MTRPAEVLVVEDNPGDQRLLREALDHAEWAKRPHIVSTSEDALAFLRRQGRFVRATRPDLVFLDMSIPPAGGEHVLSEMRRDRGLKHIPVVVFSTSAETHEVKRGYELGATSYLKKPDDLTSYFRAVDNMGSVAVTEKPRRRVPPLLIGILEWLILALVIYVISMRW